MLMALSSPTAMLPRSLHRVLSQVPKWLLNPDAPMRLKPSRQIQLIYVGGYASPKLAPQNKAVKPPANYLVSFLSRDLYHQLLN